MCIKLPFPLYGERVGVRGIFLAFRSNPNYSETLLAYNYPKGSPALPQVRSWFRAWQNWLPLALLLLTIGLNFYRFFLGEVLYWGLPSLQFYPWREFAISEFAQGRIPLWNPYNGMGAPLLANYQSALLYPPNLLYWLLPGPQTMSTLGMLHLLLAAYGMWRLTKHLDCTWFGSGIATLAYPLSSTLVARF